MPVATICAHGECELRHDRDGTNKEDKVAPIVHRVEISRSPEDVFAYVTDPSHSTEWQENSRWHSTSKDTGLASCSSP